MADESVSRESRQRGEKAVMTEHAPSRQRLRGFGIAALIIVGIAVAIFIGLNIWHASEALQ